MNIVDMVLFPNAKINIGLNVTGVLSNGYHELETVMVPVGWSDVLEIVPAKGGDETRLHCYGRKVACEPEKNLVMKAYRRLSEEVGGLPPVDIYVEKIIPDGAGLGGGSSDAAFTLMGLNRLFSLGLDDGQLAEIASKIGADCPFFIYNRPMLATGTGTDLSPITLPEFAGSIVIVKPEGSVSTAEAYRHVKVGQPEIALREALAGCNRVSDFSANGIINAFEESVAPVIGAVDEIKRVLTEAGADYVSMSGSGSAVYGLFENDNLAEACLRELGDYYVYRGRLSFGTE